MKRLQETAAAPYVVVKGERFRVLYAPHVLDDRIRALGAEISADYAGKRPILIGVLNGAFMFLADLLRVIDVDCEVDFMKLSSYGAGKVSSGNVRQLKAVDAELENRHVIVVEDIVDTGHSMDFILRLLQSYEPASLRVATLLHKVEATVKEVPLDYIGFTIPNEFVIGFGLDYGQQGRNLPAIYIREEESPSDGPDSGM
jgi:hypoxanthine phosphoribosyltransferase